MSNVNISIIDVGHGNCAVLQDNSNVVIIDAGPGTALLEYLDQEGITSINVLLISHADKDHIGGVISLLESKVKVQTICLNSDSLKKSSTWDDLCYELNQASYKGNITVRIGIFENDTGRYDCGSIRVEIVAPSTYLALKGPGSVDREGRKLTNNSTSVVFRIVKDSSPVALISGDIDDVGLLNLIESGKNISAPIAVFPHHGGRPGRGDISAFAEMYMDHVKPDNVIFSIGHRSNGTPHPDIISSIKTKNRDIRILCTQLSDQCIRNLPDRTPSHLLQYYARGKEYNKCCTGTIFIDLASSKLLILPSKDDHFSFIRKTVPTALCFRDA